MKPLWEIERPTITVGTVIGTKFYEDIAPLVVKQLEGFADEIVIIDSGDGGTETIKKCVSILDHDVVRVTTRPCKEKFLDGTPNLAAAKALAIQMAFSDYYMYLDCDELFLKSDLDEIKQGLPPADHDSPIVYRTKFYNFFGDFWHRHKNDGNLHLPRIYTNSRGLTVKSDEEFVKIHGDHEVWDADGRHVNNNYTNIPLDIRCYHYGWALGYRHTLEKYKFLQGWHDKSLDTATIVVFPHSMAPSVIPYDGGHPEIMKQHPMYDWYEPKTEVVVDIESDGEFIMGLQYGAIDREELSILLAERNSKKGQ